MGFFVAYRGSGASSGQAGFPSGSYGNRRFRRGPGIPQFVLSAAAHMFHRVQFVPPALAESRGGVAHEQKRQTKGQDERALSCERESSSQCLHAVAPVAQATALKNIGGPRIQEHHPGYRYTRLGTSTG